MGWQKIDDQFGVSQKVIRIPRKRRHQVVGLWTLAGNYAARALTDGRLEPHELDEIDARAEDVTELVRVGLWHRDGDACDSEACVPAPEGGIAIHDYLRYNPSRAEVEASREAERLRKASYRESKRSPGGTPSGTPVGSDATSGHPVPSRPVPSPDLTETTESSPVADTRDVTDSGLSTVGRTLAGQAGLLDVEAIRARILERTGRDVSVDRAVTVARWLLAKSKDPNGPRSPQRYVVRCINLSPAEVQQFIDEGGLAA